jgi:hypothetical protein
VTLPISADCAVGAMSVVECVELRQATAPAPGEAPVATGEPVPMPSRKPDIGDESRKPAPKEQHRAVRKTRTEIHCPFFCSPAKRKR